MKMPKAQQLPSGNWRIQITVDGKRIGITESTELDAIEKAARILKGTEQYNKDPLSITLEEAYIRYIESKDIVLAPSTVAEYKRMQKNDLQKLMKLPLRAITQEKVQREINSMAKEKSPSRKRVAALPFSRPEAR